MHDVGDIGAHDVGVASTESQGGKPLRVFATTFNAGNEVYTASQKFEDLAELMVRGHEDQGEEADLIFLGFQEFRDNHYKMGNLARERKLWRRLASSTMAAFRADVEAAAKAPAHVLAAKGALAKALKDLSAQDFKSNSTAAAAVNENFAPVRTWAEAALQSIGQLKGRYPNLAYSNIGNSLWESYGSSIDTVREVEALLLKGMETTAKELDHWRQQSGNLVQRLVQPERFGVGHEHVEVGMHPQKFDSGWRCEAGKHYDTFMYAYANPFSKWNITAEPFSSRVCARRSGGSQTNPGCNIDNNEGAECGKVVNLMRLKAVQGDTTLNICGLNTHMSFSGKAATRMAYIEKAMREAKRAGCDSVFFMGDFNSRVHCEEGRKQSLPPFERTGIAGQSSLQYILDTFSSTDERGARSWLRSSNLDELNQILNRDTLECYEKFRKPKPGSFLGGKLNYWDIPSTANPVKAMGLREVAPPTWPPTYKLAHRGELDGKDGAWHHCLAGEPVCFRNPSKKGKHNPAWTDRILMKSFSSTVHLQATEYSRRPVPYISSDHSPVTAKVTVRAAA